MPAANKDGAKKTPERKGTDLGAGLARKRSQDFTSKIQGWDAGGMAQQQDEIVVIEDNEETAKKDGDIVEVVLDGPESENIDVLVVDEEKGDDAPRSTGKPTPQVVLATSARTNKEVDLSKKAWVRRKSRPQAEIAIEVKAATTPKKRVVSDGHWRRDKPPKQETPPPEKEKEKDVAPKPVIMRRSVVSVGLKVPPSVQDFVEEEPAPLKVRPLRQARSRSISREREGTPDYEDTGLKVYIKRRKRSRTFGEQKGSSTSQSSFTENSSAGKATTATDITTPAQSPTKQTPPRPATAPKEKTSRNALKVEDEARRVSRHRSKTPEVEVKPRSLSRPAPKPAHKPAAPIVPAVYNNKIEGWLANTSDPFIEPDPSLTPEPLDLSKKKSRKLRSDDQTAEDEHRRHSDRSHRKRPSLERLDTGQSGESVESSLSATPTLRRNGARRSTHSPVKDRALRGETPPRDSKPTAVVSDAEVQRKLSRKGPSRSFTTGHQLSTIASAETLTGRHRAPSEASDHPTVIPDGSVLSRASDGDEPRRHGSGLRRRTTKHSDLMSVLSAQGGQAEGLKAPRSSIRRSQRAQPGKATIGDLLSELTTDELKYQRELRTLVDGVVPVLLTYVLQKSDATGAKRLFSGSSPDGQAVTQPIVQMGISLEKIKAAHKRIPLHNVEELVKWAETTEAKYKDYLKAWRLGFQDVVVNLAPAEENEGLPRNANGDLVNGDGERADVQFLLKRPLVRLKNLAKTFKGINQAKPSVAAEEMGDKYHDLVEEARQRVNDERARLEDEAAASIDATRARDPRSLAPLAGVTVDQTRSVRARDYYDLELIHSSGQQLMCKVEMILRDDAPERGSSSDILFCEVSLAGRWLLFPPIPASYVSARPGDREGEIIVMVRGMLAGGNEWRELMSLRSDDEGAVSEWLDMLSDSPAPPRLTRQSSFNTLREGYVMSGGLGDRPVSPSVVDVPIGERANEGAQKWDDSEVASVFGESTSASLRRSKAKRHRSSPSSPITEDSYEQVHHRANHLAERQRYDERPPLSSKPSRYRERPKSSYVPSISDWTETSSASTPRKEYSVWLPSTTAGSESSSGEDDDAPIRSKRPSMHRRTSSVPSMDMPTVPKVRRAPSGTPRQPSDHRHSESAPSTPGLAPASAPSKLQKKRDTPEREQAKKSEPTTPSAARPSSFSRMIPSLTPAFMKKHRRSSSPLKHEYEPSTASESLSDSDYSDEDDLTSVTSESTVEDAISTVGELKDFNNLIHARLPTQSANRKSAPPPSGGESVGPSDSASQAPYRSVPPATEQPAKTVACIFSWSDRGTWESLHPEECSIIVTPGLIEAFDLIQAGAVMSNAANGEVISPSQHGVKPLVALELTPLVPLRRGTALDISVRSPPTDKSLIRTGNNVMFRSRNPEECERLYHLINRARIDNPTYIALQNARGPVATSNWAEVMDKRNAARTNSGSWLNKLSSRKGSTYRSSGSRAASTAATESSVATVNTAFSALRRFSGNGKGIFNIAKSSLTSREGTRSTYSDSLDSGAATPIPIDPKLGTPLGLTNVKIRLYTRETMTKWRDMGSARMSVLLPPRPDPNVPANPRTTGMEKRIVVCGKSKGETLLDATLGESCFERIARTGIAVSVWEEATGPNGEVVVGAVGGVNTARARVYMIQMKSEREAAYTFGLVGKLRY